MISTREAYGEALKELASSDPNIVVLDADVSKSTMSCKFKEVAPDRFINMGIAEQDMIGTAAGIATCGKQVFASSFAIFATGRCYDQIRNTVAYSKLNVKVIGTHAGLTVGEDGPSHQALEDIALMRVIPNMRVFCPADEIETREVIKYISKTDGPFYVRLSRGKSPKIYNSMEYEFDPVKGKVLEEGKDVSLIATGIILNEVLKAAEILRENGINSEVIAINSIKPIDSDLIVSTAKKTKRVVTIEEHSIIGGLGSAVCEVLSEKHPTKMLRIGVNDQFGKSGKAEDVMKLYELDPESIARKVKNFIK